MKNTNTDRIGDWFLTASGKQFYPLDAREEDICIEDIAHGLSNVCRFGGHCSEFYSVAQHSVLVSRLVPKELEFVGLLHDATEAYIGDMVRPLKYQIPQFIEIEKALWKVIARKFNLPETDPSSIHELKRADNIALMTERRDILIHTDHEWGFTRQGIVANPDIFIEPMRPEIARSAFMGRFRELTQ